MIGHRPTRLAALAVAALVVAACSGDDDAPVDGREPADQDATAAEFTSATGEGSSDATAAEGDDGEVGEADAGPVDEPASVTVSVRAGAFDAELSAELDGPDADPFGEFASCSGLRTTVGTYSVLVSEPASAVESVSVITDEAVDGPGIYDAEVRVEPAAGTPVVGAGTVTLDPGLATGSYVAFGVADGSSIEGEFVCDGGAGEPVPLVVGADDGELDAVEVFALLRRDDAERIVGLAAVPGGAASLRCPGADGTDDGGDVLVAVEGDASVGAITAFEITSPPSPAMRIRLGSVDYEFDAPEVDAEPGATSGTFQATGPDGLSVDGAFRCT